MIYAEYTDYSNITIKAISSDNSKLSLNSLSSDYRNSVNRAAKVCVYWTSYIVTNDVPDKITHKDAKVKACCSSKMCDSNWFMCTWNGVPQNCTIWVTILYHWCRVGKYMHYIEISYFKYTIIGILLMT